MSNACVPSLGSIYTIWYSWLKVYGFDRSDCILKSYTVHSNERQAQLTTATTATTSRSTNHRGSVDVPPSNTSSAELKRDPRKEERSRCEDRRERSSKHEERHRSDERACREKRVSQYEERAKHEERARREERSRRDSSEKEKERMSRYDGKNRYDERTRRDSSEKEKVRQDRVPRAKEREQPQPDEKTRQDSSCKERTSRRERRMTTDKIQAYSHSFRCCSHDLGCITRGGGAVDFSRDDKRLSEGEKREDWR